MSKLLSKKELDRFRKVLDQKDIYSWTNKAIAAFLDHIDAQDKEMERLRIGYVERSYPMRDLMNYINQERTVAAKDAEIEQLKQRIAKFRAGIVEHAENCDSGCVLVVNDEDDELAKE